jgi:hypothetical protein
VNALRCTRYFLYTRGREDRKDIRFEWIEHVTAHPIKEHVQADGRIRRWARIPEAGGRVLRVVLLEDGQTVHNAFFDRSFHEVNDEH